MTHNAFIQCTSGITQRSLDETRLQADQLMSLRTALQDEVSRHFHSFHFRFLFLFCLKRLQRQLEDSDFKARESVALSSQQTQHNQ